MKTFFTFENLYKAYIDCRKRKGLSLYHMRFAENLEVNLLSLEKRLQNRTYKPGRSIAFIVQKPKIREIFAADFADRVVHHLLYNYLSPVYERQFIHDSWACRKDKGTHGAMLRLLEFARKLERERKRERAGAPPPPSLRGGTTKQSHRSDCRASLTMTQKHPFFSKWISKAFSPQLISKFCTI